VDFDLTDEQQAILETWNKFLDREIRPSWGPTAGDVHISPEQAKGLLQRTIPFGVGAGWTPEEGGGAGLDFLTSGLMYEALSKVSPDLHGIAQTTEGVAHKLFHAGSPALKEKYLGRMMRGEIIACSAISEPGSGSDVRSLTATAERDGDHFVLKGEKLWTSNITIADIALVVVRTGERELSLLLLDREEHGYEVREVEKLGLSGWSFGQLLLDGVRVPVENVVGNLGDGLRLSMGGFERARCFISLMAIGIGAAALESAVDYSKSRVQFGRPIAEYQLVQDLLAESATLLDASRLLVYRCLSHLGRGGNNLEASMAKSFTTESVQRVTSNAVQVFGAMGLTKESGIERHFRNARMLTIPDGTTQINRLVIGRELTGISAFRPS
jgi:alkylation response protein AidB-like acyl-CoA dehydrogenase